MTSKKIAKEHQADSDRDSLKECLRQIWTRSSFENPDNSGIVWMDQWMRMSRLLPSPKP
jgi:hypothetical protein